MVSKNIAIRGRFTFNLYHSGLNVPYSSQYVDNFITSTGLSYPASFAFADCFRFISIGSGTAANSITSNGGLGTTGLQFPISKYSYIGSRNSENVSQYEPETCGFREQNDKVILSRGWRLPTGELYFEKDYNLEEFMVSPGRPYVVGIDGSKACSSSTFTNYGVAGLDGATASKVYSSPTLCDATAAFARVLKSLSIKKDDFLVATYDLSLVFNTGIQDISLTVDNGTSTNPNWDGTINAKANIVHHGINLISDAEHPSYIFAEQPSPDFYYPYEYGESFVPLWGNPLEPSMVDSKFVAYLSTDNIQFLANRISGGRSLVNNIEDIGTMAWRRTPTQDALPTFPSQFLNIRQDGSKDVYPNKTNYTGANVSAETLPFDVSFIKNSRFQHTPMVYSPRDSRSRTGIYSAQFWIRTPQEIAFLNKPVRSLVIGYYNSLYPDMVYPFYDLLFADRTNSYPAHNESNATYTLPTDTNPPTNYFYLENGGILTLSFNMSWSSPCDSLVEGC